MATLHAKVDRWWNGISLRTKITGVTVLLLTFGLTVAGIGTMNVLRNYLLDQTDAQIAAAYDEVKSNILDEDNGVDLGGANTFGEERTGLNPYYVALVTVSGRVVVDNLPADQRQIQPDTADLDIVELVQKGSSATISSGVTGLEWRLKAYGPINITIGSSESADELDGAIVIASSLRDTENTIGNFALIFFGFAVAVVVLGAAITQLLVTSTFAPLRDVERTAARFAAGDYSQRLGGATPNTEVGRLNRSLNTMLARIDRAFSDRARSVEQMRRFVGDASHELRTPLVSLRGYAELYRMGALQKPEDVAQAMDRIEREAIRMGALVQDLLELARLDEKRAPELAPVDLLPIAQDAALDTSASNQGRTITVVVPRESEVEDAVTTPDGMPSAGQPTAPLDTASLRTGDPTGAAAGATAANLTGPIAFAGATWARLRGRRRPRAESMTAGESEVASTSRPLPSEGPVVLADENKIRQVVTNLMGNAMRFTPDDSPIEIEVDVDRKAGYGAISIVDHGEGIPPQLREKIFQRFWRADTSRTRDTGGSGLGLAIVAGIVANHDGHVEVLETPGGGATFRVSLPLLPSAPSPDDSTDATPEPQEPSPAP